MASSSKPGEAVGATIHPTAVVDPTAVLGAHTIVGPFAVIEANVTLGERCRIDAHAVLRTGTRLGRENVVHPFVVLGGAPQDSKHAGEPTTLSIGDKNTFREHFTAHRGTALGGGITRIGNHGLFMVGSHVAHDAAVGDGVTLTNGTVLGGHVTVGNYVVMGGLVAIAPFVVIGQRAFIAGGAMVERNVPPFVIAAGDRAKVRALNRVGLVRAEIDPRSRAALADAFRKIFRGNAARARTAKDLVSSQDPYVRELAEFVLRPNHSIAAAPAPRPHAAAHRALRDRA